MKTTVKIRRSIRAISPVISVLLMIAIAVAAALVAYAWIMGYMGSTTNKVGKAILIQSMGLNPGNEDYLRVYVQNVGQSTVEFDPTSCVYINDVRGTLSDFGTDGINVNPLPEGQTATIEVDLSALGISSDYIKVKVVTKGGTFSETKDTVTVSGLPSAYTLTLTTTPDDGSGGSVAQDPSPPYAPGTTVQLTANPEAGWSFSSWGGDLSGSTNPENILMNGDKTVTATFTQDEYSIIVTVDPSSAAGSVDADISPPYHYNDVVTLTPHANSGYTFDHWSGDGAAGTGDEWVVTVTDNMDVTAHFTVVRLPIYVSTANQVHDIPNVGSHSSFVDMQNDGAYDTLTETNVAGTASWTTPDSVNSKCGDESSHRATSAIDGNYGTYWRHDHEDAHWIVFDMGQSVTVTQVRIYQDNDNDHRWPSESGHYVDVYVSDSPTSWGSVDLDNWDANNGGGWQTSGTFSATGRYVILQMNSGHDEDHARMYEFQAYVAPPENYQLGLEVQFAGVTDYSYYTQLEIKTGTLATENLAVDYWDGASWQPLTIALTANTVNTFTVSLSGPTFDLRFIDTTRTGDTTPSTWQIDYVRLVAP
jgi:uncharacterized repeat protein (TIGR02543 family)